MLQTIISHNNSSIIPIIMADETSDIGHHGQISIVIRYFDDDINMSRPVETFVSIKEHNNEIMYMNCYSHCLNLTLIDAVCDKKMFLRID